MKKIAEDLGQTAKGIFLESFETLEAFSLDLAEESYTATVEYFKNNFKDITEKQACKTAVMALVMLGALLEEEKSHAPNKN